MKSVLILSGGMDSATLLAWHLNKGHDVTCISFNYGQRHRKELAAAAGLCDYYKVPWSLVDLNGLQETLTGSALTDSMVEVPHGHYEAETMKATVVPSRNAFMLSMAFGAAVSMGADGVSIGAHSGDHAVYPDCKRVVLSLVAGRFKPGHVAGV